MARSGSPRVSVVVPTCNEARNVELLLPQIAAVRPAVAEIIVADRGSPDGTAEAARRALPWVKVVRQTRAGKGNALACGFAAATGDVLATLDADGSMDPGELPALVAALLGGADFVTGSRFVTGGAQPGSGPRRRARLAVRTGLAQVLVGARQTDLGYGLHAFWADLLPALELPSIAAPAADGQPWGDGDEIDILLSCRAEAAGRLAEVPSRPRVPPGRRPGRRTAADDRRLLRVLTVERQRLRRRRARRPPAATPAGSPPRPPSDR